MSTDIHEVNLSGVYIPSENIVARDIEGELIIVPIESGMADFSNTLYTLNETGRRIWEKLPERESLGRVAEKLAEEYSASPDTIQKDVLDLIQTLLKMKIVRELKQ